MERGERVQPPGLSDARVSASNVAQVFAVGRGRRTRVNRGNAERIARAQQRKKEEQVRMREFQKDDEEASGNNQRVGIATLGLFMATGKLQKNDQAVKDLQKIIGSDQFKNGLKDKTTTIGSLTYKLIEIVGKSDKLKKLFSVSSEYGVVYDRRQALPDNTIFDFKFRITDSGGDSKVGIFTLFTKSLKISVRSGYFNCTSENDFSGLGSQPRAIGRALFNVFGKNPGLPPLRLENVLMSLRSGRKFNEKDFIKDVYSNDTFMGMKLNKKTKQSVSKVFMLLGSKEHTLSITKGGVFQVSLKKAPTKDEIKDAIKKIKSIQTAASKYFGGKSTIATRKRKISSRTNDQPAPNVARKGTTCPPAKRPTPYSFGGKCPDGHYLRPNPQQQPCCYKIPRDKTKSKNKVALAYKTANVRVPDNVSAMFGLNRNTSNRRVNISTNFPDIKLYKTVTRVRKSNGTMVNVPDVRIGSRQCLRYTKQKILDFISRIGYTDKSLESKSKEQLCAILVNIAKNTNANKTNNKYIPTFTFKGKKTQLTLKMDKILMIGRRECRSLPKSDMQKACGALGIQFDGLTREQMCAKIEEKRAEMQKKLNSNKNSNMKLNVKKKLNAENAAIERARKMKLEKIKKRDDLLYQMFVTKVEPFVQKYENYGSRNLVPNKTTYLKHFKTSVNVNAANAVNDVNKRGWKRGFEIWLKKYVLQFKSAYEQELVNAKAVKDQQIANARRAVAEEAKRKREQKRLLASLTPEGALKDMNAFKKKLPKNLQNAFDKKKKEFAESYRKFVVLDKNATLSGVAGRKRAFFDFQKMDGGNIRTYLNSVVSKMPPKRNANTIQRYQLNNKLRLVLGPKITSNTI